jgi:transposase-like protein
MREAKMDGWVDQNLRQWKNPAGQISSVETIKGRQLACPACRAEQRVSELVKPAGHSRWRCASGHSFDAAPLSGEDRNYFF